GISSDHVVCSLLIPSPCIRSFRVLNSLHRTGKELPLKPVCQDPTSAILRPIIHILLSQIFTVFVLVLAVSDVVIARQIAAPRISLTTQHVSFLGQLHCSLHAMDE